MENLSIKESAVGIHEVFVSLKDAGFTHGEALWLVGCLVKGVPLPEKLAKMIEESL